MKRQTMLTKETQSVVCLTMPSVTWWLPLRDWPLLETGHLSTVRKTRSWFLVPPMASVTSPMVQLISLNSSWSPGWRRHWRKCVFGRKKDDSFDWSEYLLGKSHLSSSVVFQTLIILLHISLLFCYFEYYWQCCLKLQLHSNKIS